MNETDPSQQDYWYQELGAEGALAKVIEGFSPREQQQAMASHVAAAIKEDSAVIIEAGTGVGKTFAYLVPALSSGGKVIISTGTKTLQDQLFLKDIPLVKKALKTSTRVALLKGRANYLCLYRLQQALHDSTYRDRRSIGYLQRIKDWSIVTTHGEIAEIRAVPRDSEVWPSVTSTADNCLSAECPNYDECYIANARKEAQEADIVVVNHHLFFADMALKEEGFGELLPSANTVILDESHQLPEIASNFFSITFSSRQVRDLAKDILAEAMIEKDMPDLIELSRTLDSQIQDMRLLMDKPGIREPWYKINTKPAIETAVADLNDLFSQLEIQLNTFAERGKGLQNCLERVQAIKNNFTAIQKSGANTVQWYETFTRSFTLVSTPLDISDQFKKQMDTMPCAWVFTSATLAVDNSFEHFVQRMGIDNATELQLDSPFDYWHHALMYAPPNIPEPQQGHFVEEVIKAALPVIEACQGGVFMLFTSYRALNEAVEWLSDAKEIKGRKLLVQGEASQHDMIEQFRKAGNAVLLGTGSFWEGVDVRGTALSCVIIDKLPFASPFDPVTEARIQSIRNNKGNPFAEFQLPHAVIVLKQGVGRLIRDMNDRGVLVICDPRLRTKFYGKVFLESLPRIPRTQKIDVVKRFFALTEHSDENTSD
ncbi:MAG: ATP-dependent DNA helicase [Thiotrichaceae bacterium]|nr:ATP-dependent DNA helicase [Thiotrichaceae bacterium]